MEFVRQGDVGYYPFSQLLRLDEREWQPKGEPPPTVKGIPVFDGMKETTVSVDGIDYLMRHWNGLGVVIDVTSELMNSEHDSRVTVAPLVPKEAVKVNWNQAVDGRLAGVLSIPAVDRGSIDADFPEADLSDVILAVRSVTTISRGIVSEGRLMSLTPRMVAVLASKLSEMFGERAWARMSHFPNVEGRRLERVDDIGKKSPPPTDGKWAVLTFDNGERMQVFVNPE